MKESLRKNIRYLTALAMIPAGAELLSLYQSYLDRITPQPNPTQFRDVNLDGLEDKIIQKRATMDLLTAELRLPFHIDEVFYGVDINGQRVYVAESVYNDIMKQRQIQRNQ